MFKKIILSIVAIATISTMASANSEDFAYTYEKTNIEVCKSSLEHYNLPKDKQDFVLAQMEKGYTESAKTGNMNLTYKTDMVVVSWIGFRHELRTQYFFKTKEACEAFFEKLNKNSEVIKDSPSF